MDKTERERLTVILLARDKQALRSLAEREGEAMTVVVRRLIRDAAERVDVSASAGEGQHGNAS